MYKAAESCSCPENPSSSTSTLRDVTHCAVSDAAWCTPALSCVTALVYMPAVLHTLQLLHHAVLGRHCRVTSTSSAKPEAVEESIKANTEGLSGRAVPIDSAGDSDDDEPLAHLADESRPIGLLAARKTAFQTRTAEAFALGTLRDER